MNVSSQPINKPCLWYTQAIENPDNLNHTQQSTEVQESRRITDVSSQYSYVQTSVNQFLVRRFRKSSHDDDVQLTITNVLEYWKTAHQRIHSTERNSFGIPSKRTRKTFTGIVPSFGKFFGTRRISISSAQQSCGLKLIWISDW